MSDAQREPLPPRQSQEQEQEQDSGDQAAPDSLSALRAASRGEAAGDRTAAQPADSAMEVLRELVELQGSEPAVDDLVDGTWLAWDAKRTAAWERARALTRQGDAA